MIIKKTLAMILLKSLRFAFTFAAVIYGLMLVVGCINEEPSWIVPGFLYTASLVWGAVAVHRTIKRNPCLA